MNKKEEKQMNKKVYLVLQISKGFGKWKGLFANEFDEKTASSKMKRLIKLIEKHKKLNKIRGRRGTFNYRIIKTQTVYVDRARDRAMGDE